MASPTTVSFRTDQVIEAALDRLRVAYATTSRSEVIRHAILEADRQARREQLRRDAESLMADEAEVTETLRVNAEMARYRAR